jgi:hypothetical protein
MAKAKMATRMIEKKVMIRRRFMAPFGSLNFRLIFPQEAGQTPRNPLLEFDVRPEGKLFRFILCDHAGRSLREGRGVFAKTI